MMLANLVGMVVCAVSALVGPSALERFDERDWSRLEAASRDFVMVKGTLWDRSVERRQDEAKGRKGISEREAEALGVGGVDPCQTVPLWYDAVSRTQLDRQDEIDRACMADESLVKNEVEFECLEILPDGHGIAQKTWIQDEPISKSNRARKVGDPPIPTRPVRKYGDTVALLNHSLKKTGDRESPSFVKRTDKVVNHAGKTIEVLEIPSVRDLDAAVQPVSLEQLAQAILDGKAKLTDWRWDRKTERDKPTAAFPKGRERTVITWIPKDVTPKPARDKP